MVLNQSEDDVNNSEFGLQQMHQDGELLAPASFLNNPSLVPTTTFSYSKAASGRFIAKKLDLSDYVLLADGISGKPIRLSPGVS